VQIRSSSGGFASLVDPHAFCTPHHSYQRPLG
jgi:hypothetical protein